jgi:hypothetical protein
MPVSVVYAGSMALFALFAATITSYAMQSVAAAPAAYDAGVRSFVAGQANRELATLMADAAISSASSMP